MGLTVVDGFFLSFFRSFLCGNSFHAFALEACYLFKRPIDAGFGRDNPEFFALRVWFSQKGHQ